MDNEEEREIDLNSFEELFAFLDGLTPEQKAKLQSFVDLMRGHEIQTQEAEQRELVFYGEMNDGRRVKMLHFPREVLGSDGPVVLPSADEGILLGAVSYESLAMKRHDLTEEHGEDHWVMDNQWQFHMHELAVQLIEIEEESRCFDWNDLLA